MDLTIHRGTREIGGNVVEIANHRAADLFKAGMA